MKNGGNQKGFTLTELIATLVILSLVLSISTILFIGVRKNILQKEYDNLVMYLETKASEYAFDTNITLISVEDLIIDGYVKPDDETDVYDPRNKTSMNCFLIKSTYKDGVYESKLSENIGSSDGKCNTYKKYKDIEICRVVDGNCVSIGNDGWFKEDITLGIKYRNSLLTSENAIYNWVSTNGFSSDEATIVTKTELISHNTYKCEIVVDGVYGEATHFIGIDKQKPKVTSVKFDEGWATSKEVVISATDMDGSGIKGYGFDNDTCESFEKQNKFVVTFSGTYNYCVVDKAGNVTTESVKIDKIKSKPSKPEITASDGVLSGAWHKNDFTLNFSSKVGDGLGEAIYYYGTSKDNLTNNGNDINVSENGVTYYVKACDSTGECSDISSYEVKLDKGKPASPTFTASDGITSDSWHKNSFTLSIGGSSAPSGITYYYGLNSNDVNIAQTSISVDNATTGTTYYAKACNGVGVCSELSSYVAKLDKTSSIAAPKITASDNVASGSWHKQYFTLSFSGSTSASGITYYYGTKSSSLNNRGSSVYINSETGGTTYYAKACNGAGLCSDVSSYLVMLDVNATIAAPKITASDSVASGSWHKANFTLSFSGSTSASGITYYYGTSSYSLNNTGTTVSISSETSGTTYYVKACNAFNKCSSTSSYIVKLDKTSPSVPTVNMNKSSYYGSSYTSDTWTSENVYIVLSYSKTDTSGITKYQYSNDNSRWYDMSSDRTYISTSGTTNMYFRAIDGAGNIGTSSSKYVIKIDKDKPIAPTVSLTYYKNYSNKTYTQKTWVNGEIKATLSYAKTDASGIAKYQYSYDSYSWSDVSGSAFTNKKEGQVKMYFRAIDNAGNVGQVAGAYDLWYDCTAPKSINSVTIRKGSATGTIVSSGSWGPSPIYIIPSYTSTDTSGIAGFKFSVGNTYSFNGPYANYKIDTVGQSTVYIKAVDNAGNEGPNYSVSVKVSKYLVDYPVGAYVSYGSKSWRIINKNGSGQTGKVTLISADCLGSTQVSRGVTSSIGTANAALTKIAQQYYNRSYVYSASPITNDKVATYSNSNLGGTVKCDYFAAPSNSYYTSSYIYFVQYNTNRAVQYTQDYVKNVLTSNRSGGTRVVLVMNAGLYTTTTNDGGSQYKSLTFTN